jgi:alkanesulfonate monooxygenase SsuD/methylene tetrahydromethanopterin reductase-like flavin-dependent oxidoreductase (luciferase family)
MRIALGLPSRIVGASAELMLEWATRADRGPFSSLVVTDRVVSQALEPLAVLAIVAGATKRVRLMTSVVIGPTRETTLLARQTATIDLLSGGRLSLGVGIGVRENDYLATGFAFRRRGRRVDEQLPILRRLWAGESLSKETGSIGPLRRALAARSSSSAVTSRRWRDASQPGATVIWRRAEASRKAC